MSGTNYIRQSTFTDGDIITAALFNNEYNQIQNAFVYAATGTTGHRHDGTSGQGGNIHTIGDQDFDNKIVVDSTNNRWGFFVSVGDVPVEQIRIQDGAIVPVTDDDIDLGTSSLEFKDLYIDGTAYLDAISFNGTVISATAAELNTLDGITSTVAELNILDGVTATTTELNYTDGVTSSIQTQIDTKAPTASPTFTGTLTAPTINASTSLEIAGTALTVTAAELNTLDGITATTAELNILDGVTATTAELNTLDGITATVAELNALDGITATVTELNLLDGVTATTAEINYLDGVTSNIQIQINALQTGDTDLEAIAALTPTDSVFIVGDGSTWVAETGATARASLGLTIGTDVLAYDSNLQSFVTTFTIPTTDGTSGQALLTDGAGNIAFGDVDALPTQTGNSGYFLTTDGTNPSWAEVDALPTQTGNSGKYLTTDGTEASWDDIAQVAYTRTTYTATSGQVNFAASYDAGYVDVFLNGIKLVEGTDFTASGGSNVALTTGAVLNDSVEILAYTTASIVSQVKNPDGGFANSVYTIAQNINGGTA